MIEFINVKKNYGPHLVLNDLTFRLEDRGVIGLLGNNGAGKTTLLKLLTGYHCPTEGDVKINGFSTLENLAESLFSVGYLPETAPLYPGLTVTENLKFSYKIKTGEKTTGQEVQDVIDRLALKEVENQKVELLSHGYKQRTALGMSIINNPSVLVLDEPTNGLDPRQIIETRNFITDYGKENLVVFSTHNIHEVLLSCTHVMILHHGRICASGTPGELMELFKVKNLEEVFIECTKN